MKMKCIKISSRLASDHGRKDSDRSFSGYAARVQSHSSQVVSVVSHWSVGLAVERFLHDPTFSHFDTIPARDGQTDRQTDAQMAYTALA